MAGNYDDGEIYYDNMEIMESIERRKNARINSTPKMAIPQNRPPVNAFEKPPVLPPKKKNAAKSHTTNAKATPEKNAKQLPRTQVSSPPQQARQTNPIPKPVQVWNHPGLLRTRSIVEEPLAPIVEEDAIHDISPRGSVPEVEILQQESSSKKQSINNVPLEEVKNPNGNRAANTSPHIPCLQQNLSESSMTGAAKNIISRPVTLNAEPLKKNSHLNLGPKAGAAISDQDVENDNSVRPYGMVDVRWVEKNVEASIVDSDEMNGRSSSSGDVNVQNSGKLPAAQNGVAHGSRIEVQHSGKHGSSTSLSSLRENSESRIFGSGNSGKEDTFDSSRNSFDQDSSSGVCGVCAYMSIPIHSQEAPKDTVHTHTSQRNDSKTGKVNMSDNKNYFRDDEYIYDEIEDYAKDEGIQKALTDIDKVLESIGNENVARTSSFASKRFPIPTDQTKHDNAQYDNFFYRGNEAALQTSSPNRNPRSNPPLPKEQPTITDIRTRSFGMAQTRESNDTDVGFLKPRVPEIHSPVGAFSSYVPVQSDVSVRDRQNNYIQSNNSRSLPRLNSKTKLSSFHDERDSGERELSESSGSSIPYRSGVSDPQSRGSDSLTKSGQSLERISSDSVSRKSSRVEIEGSSEGDAHSFSGLHGETLPSRRKSTGNPTSSAENLKGSTKSLGRSNSCERKKSSFRSKFKFRTRSKSQERFYGDSDSMGHLSGVSDVDEKNNSRQRGSRLRRRLSRKRMENKDSSERKSSEGYDAEAERSRASTPVSFIRKLLRKSKNDEEGNSRSSRKAGPNSSGSEDSFSRTSSFGQNQSQSDAPREKQLVSPPSRRARKMLHTRQTREKAVLSDSSNSGSDNEVVTSRKGETLKTGDEYLEPCEPKYQSKNSAKERGRKGSSQRNKGSRGRRPEKDTDRSGISSFHRDKYRALVSLNAQTLKKITEKWLTEWRNRLPVGGFLITSWADIVIASKRPQCILGKTVIYEAYFSTNPGHRLACQIFDKTDVNQRLIRQLENCSTLIAHPNLCSVCSHFHCKIPGSLMYPPRDEMHSEALCVVLANVPATSLTTYLGRLREVKEQKQVHKQILLMVLQLLQALDNLSRAGFNLSYINADHLIVTQEMGLLQILPHMADNDDSRTSSPGKPTIIQQVSALLSWMLQGCLDPISLSSHPSQCSTYLSSLKRTSIVLTSSPHDFGIDSLQSLVQCAVWGPRSLADIDTSHESVLEALAAWIDVKQAELVSDIAVLFSAKDFLPIYMFYKHQYFSRVDPKNLYQNLRILGRI